MISSQKTPCGTGKHWDPIFAKLSASSLLALLTTPDKYPTQLVQQAKILSSKKMSFKLELDSRNVTRAMRCDAMRGVAWRAGWAEEEEEECT
jgi:hypothetical protein